MSYQKQWQYIMQYLNINNIKYIHSDLHLHYKVITFYTIGKTLCNTIIITYLISSNYIHQYLESSDI